MPEIIVPDEEVLKYASAIQAETPSTLTLEKTVELPREVPNHVLRATFDMMEVLRSSLPKESERGLFYTAINVIDHW